MAATTKKGSKKASPKTAPVLDLKAIETELNKDPAAQKAFLRNPGRFMEERGVKLRTSDKSELKNLASQITSGPSLPAGTEGAARAGITIVIRRRF